MMITCLHGYFIFRETEVGEIAKFNSDYGQDLVSKDDYYTFELLADAPEYSIATKPYLNLVANTTYAGKPWEVMEENYYVYNFTLGALVLASSITQTIEPTKTYEGFRAPGLIQPGTVNTSWLRILGYQAHLDIGSTIFRYTEFFYAN